MTARRRRTTATRLTFGALALGLTLFGAGGGAVFAAGAPGDVTGLPGTEAQEPVPPATPEVTPPEAGEAPVPPAGAVRSSVSVA
ncbi:MAG: hypothetical protein ACRDYV_11625, partial [Acidimicrobiia bacterium]